MDATPIVGTLGSTPRPIAGDVATSLAKGAPGFAEEMATQMTKESPEPEVAAPAQTAEQQPLPPNTTGAANPALGSLRGFSSPAEPGRAKRATTEAPNTNTVWLNTAALWMVPLPIVTTEVVAPRVDADASIAAVGMQDVPEGTARSVDTEKPFEAGESQIAAAPPAGTEGESAPPTTRAAVVVEESATAAAEREAPVQVTENSGSQPSTEAGREPASREFQGTVVAPEWMQAVQEPAGREVRTASAETPDQKTHVLTVPEVATGGEATQDLVENESIPPGPGLVASPPGKGQAQAADATREKSAQSSVKGANARETRDHTRNKTAGTDALSSSATRGIAAELEVRVKAAVRTQGTSDQKAQVVHGTAVQPRMLNTNPAATSEINSDGFDETETHASSSSMDSGAKASGGDDPADGAGTESQASADAAAMTKSELGSLLPSPAITPHIDNPAAGKGNAAREAEPQRSEPMAGTVSEGMRGSDAVTNVQIAGNTSQSEIHVAMQGEKLGGVELHARISGEQVGAAIVVEKKETHAALAVELPVLQQALHDKNLRVEHVWLTQGMPQGLDGGAADSFPGQGQNEARRPWQADGGVPIGPDSNPFSNEQETLFDERGRLSVRA